MNTQTKPPSVKADERNNVPAGGAVAAIPLFDRVEFALRDAGFDYDLAFALATLATTAQPPATVPVEAVLALVDKLRYSHINRQTIADELESLVSRGNEGATVSSATRGEK